MLDDATTARIPAWLASKEALLGRLGRDDLHVIRSGHLGTTIRIGLGDSESVVIARLPQVQIKRHGNRQIIVPESQRDQKYREINFSDDQIAAILKCWQDGVSALTLAFVAEIVDKDGHIRSK